MRYPRQRLDIERLRKGAVHRVARSEHPTVPVLGRAGHACSLRNHTNTATDPGLDCCAVSIEEIDEYLRTVEEPKRSTLEALRRTILEIVPEAEQVISYRVPAFRVHGQVIAGFAAFKDHLSYLPFSGSVLEQLVDELDGYAMTKSSLHFPVAQDLPKALVEKLIATRLAEVKQRSRR